jgi:hypothetical protein
VPVRTDAAAGTARIRAESCLDRREPPPVPPQPVTKCQLRLDAKPEYMCDEECVPRGFASCVRPADLPLCRGACSSEAPKEPKR